MNPLKQIIFTLLMGNLALAQLCSSWSGTQVLGALDTNLLPEASGLSDSKQFPDRLYHVNDSERNYHIYLSNFQGQTLNSSRLDVDVSDVEDIDLSICPLGTCIYIADIGDNLQRRSAVQIYYFEENETFASPIAVQTLELVYPDGAHDAESFAVHPSGDIYILTKEPINILRTTPAKLYRLAYETWSQNPASRHTLEFVLEIDFFTLSNFTVDVFSHLATSMDFSEAGQRLLVLTYGNAYEFAFDKLLEGLVDYRVINLDRSFQQEAITYVQNDLGFVFTAEGRTTGNSPIKQHLCED